MCFSAEASFTAAAVLGLCGGVLVNRFKDDKSKIFLATIPLFFALQQFSEGVLWRAFDAQEYGSSWSHIAQYSFMFFAYLFWPVWIPFSYWMSEKVEWRKYVMCASLLAGMLFYCYLVFAFFTTPSIGAKVVGHSIVYATGTPFVKGAYVSIVLLPMFVSSIPHMWIIGLLTGVSFFVADYAYTYAYVSLWCFVSAIIFGGLYFILKPDAQENRLP